MVLEHCPTRLLCLLGTLKEADVPTSDFGYRLQLMIGGLRSVSRREEKDASAAATADALLASFDFGLSNDDCGEVGSLCPLEDYFLIEAQADNDSVSGGRGKRAIELPPHRKKSQWLVQEQRYREHRRNQRLRHPPQMRRFIQDENDPIRSPIDHLLRWGRYPPPPTLRQTFSRNYWKKQINHPLMKPVSSDNLPICKRCEAKRNVCFVVS